LLATSFGFGFRHGIDWDHIAALTDITSAQESSRRSLLLATLYALGHALVVAVLGVGAIVLAEQLPEGIDAVMERFVGATLIVLGVYVFVALARHGQDFRMRSRWMLLLVGVRRGRNWIRARSEPVVIEHEHQHPVEEIHSEVDVNAHSHSKHQHHHTGQSASRHSHVHRHVAPVPDDPFLTYGNGTAFGIGMLHGIGAETPTQLLIFLAASQAGGKVAGVVLLSCFVAGLLTSNSVVALAATFGYRSATNNYKAYVAVSLVTAVFSLVIGALFLLGWSGLLPTIFSG
jgi:high-affinity nickel-transport protein